MAAIIIRGVKDEHGWLGNMAPFPVEFDNELWPTTEALFQSLRFDGEEIRSEIRRQKSPMTAKMIAKKHKKWMVVEPMSDADLDNMRLCLRLKAVQHPQLQDMLVQTGDALIVEDCTKRQRASGLFWGAAMIDGQWAGQNWLGRLWMEYRDSLMPSGMANLNRRPAATGWCQ